MISRPLLIPFWHIELQSVDFSSILCLDPIVVGLQTGSSRKACERHFHVLDVLLHVLRFV